MNQNASLSLDGPNGGPWQVPQGMVRRAGLTADEWVGAPSGPEDGWQERPPAPGRSCHVDELEAAVARLAETSRTRPATGLHDLESLLSAAADGERRSRENALKTATALHSVTRWMERAEERLDEGQERSAAALAAVARLERSLSRGERSDGDGPSEIDEERARMTERPAAPSQGPIGRRGIDARDEVRIAVAEIRSRQSALDAGRAATPAPRRRPAPHGPVESRAPAGAPPRGDALHDIARLISRLEATGRPAVDRDAAAVAAIREDMGRVQAAIAELATRAEVGALERSVLEFASQVAEARAPDDVAAFQVPIEALQAEVRRLSQAVVSGLPGRLTGDLDHLARRIDAAAGTGLDPSVVSGLSREAAQMRRALADTADPDRVEDLARLLTDVSAQVTELASRQVDAFAFSELKSGVDEIRATLRESRLRDEPSADYTPQFEGLARNIERLSTRMDRAFPAGAGSDAAQALLQRLDRLDETLQRPAREEMKPLEDMLRSLADKVDSAERTGAGSPALDAIERQVAALADRLDDLPFGSHPALVSLEGAMRQLMGQVEELRDETLQAAEQAARTAVADRLGGAPGTPAAPAAADLGVLERDLAELKAHHATSDKRTHDSLDAVRGTLEQIAHRLAALERDGTEPARSPVRGRDDASARAPAAPAARPGTAPRALDLDRPIANRGTDEVLLEPGATRPTIERPAERPAKPAGAPDAGSGDVKANFIAAARRAAQAAAAEAAAQATAASRLPKREPVAAEAGRPGLAARAATVLDKRRRPIVLGLAAAVLAIGAVQVGGLLRGAPKPVSRVEPQRAEPAARPTVAKPDGVREASEPRVASPTANAAAAAPESAPAPPQNAPAPPRDREGSLPAPQREAASDAPAKAAERPAETPPAAAAPSAKPATATLERIPDMASVGDIPAVLNPPALRQAALAGEPAAVYEVAARAAEGRGMPRDLKLALRLFEKAAAHGLAPAQYRLGNFYEKGLGTPRDLAIARQWYQRAAERNNAKAMHNLAVLLAEGGAGKPDYPAAIEWFRRGAEHGVRDSQFNLAVLLARGLGTAQDFKASYTWFAIAAQQGDDDAAKKRDEVGARMAPAELAAAKAAVERWRPATADQAANEVPLPAGNWTEAPARKTAASGRV